VLHPKFEGSAQDWPFGLDAGQRLRLAEQFFIDTDACVGRGETMLRL
jgi:hypothetical protein